MLIGEALRDWIASDTEDLESHIAWLDSQEKSGEPRCDICRRDPHFRFVPVDDDWRPLPDVDGEPVVEAETLQALIAADPLRENTERELSPAAYDGAFDAWDLARNLGLRPPEPVDPLPPVEEDEVHLVAWMAVRAGHQTD
ncbi:MAG: hypothetical protein J4F98_13150 [Acidobacteria bacterium]|nr:hypothetical protein [Acidobacteriota bacterium]